MIKTLDGISHIQQRAELYVGNTEYSTSLFKEAFDNAKDEILAGRCNRVDVFLVKDNNGNLWNIIRDWANGIPLTSPELPGKDVPIEICTSINTSGKFDKNNNSSEYIIAAGQNGQGLKAVNALSSYLYLTTKAHDADDNYWEYFFQDGKFISKKLIKLQNNTFDTLFGTEIKFLPNPKYFQNPVPDENVIMNDLLVSKYALGDNISINYNGSPVQNTYYAEFIKPNPEQVITGEVTSKTTQESCKIDICLCENLSDGKLFQGIVNLLSCNEGTHNNMCFNLLKNKLFAIAEKKKKHVQINDLLVPLRVLCNLKLRDSRFESQTKIKLAVRNDVLQSLIEPVIDQLIKNNSSFFEKVIDKAEEYRINLESSKASKKSKLGKTIQVRGLRDCSSKNRNERSLYLVEGNSAAGSAIKARDARIHGILPLRGKLLNVIQATKSKILNNDVINSIANTLGYKLYGEVNPEKCRYSSIFITTDADNDGFHIACLLTFVFYTLFPELIKAGMLYVILCPLYGVTVNKQFIPIFDDITRQQYNNQGIVTRRFKGLGEMCANELKVSMFDINYRRCLQLKYSDFDLIKLWNEQMGKLTYEEN